MAINKKELFKTVPIKGKQKGNVEVCNYDKKIVIQPNDKDAKGKVEACYDKRPKTSNISVGGDTLQAPNNEWMVIKDTQYYKVPDSQKGTVTAQQGVGLGRISKVRANLVFVRYQGTLRKMLKMDKNAPYNYIDAEAAIPYYQYLLKNKNSYMSDPKSMELIAWAEGIDKKIKEGKMSFDGEESSFDGNTALDLSFDGEDSSSADGSKKFKVVKPQAKVFAQDKSTGVIHFTKRKLGKGSKVSGTILPKGDFKFRKKNKKTNAISLVTKTAGFVKIGENDKANILVHIGSLRPIVKKSSFDGNTTLDLSFDGNTNIDLSIQGGRMARPRRRKLTPEQVAKRKAKRAAVVARRAKHKAAIAARRSKKSSFEGNTNLDLGFDGNTNLDLSFDGGYHRPKIETVPNNLDLGIDGRYKNRGRHLGTIRRLASFDGNTNLDLSFNGGSLNEDFHGGGDMLYFDGSEEMSNAIGDWFKKQKEKREIKKLEKAEKKALSKEQASVLADPRKVVYTEEEMKDVYKSSGSSKPFSEWTKGEGAKNMLNSIAQFGAAWLQAKSKQAEGETGEGDRTSEEIVEEQSKTGAGADDKGDKKILGMHPITFGIVATVVGLAAIGTIVYLSKKGSAPATTPAIGA